MSIAHFSLEQMVAYQSEQARNNNLQLVEWYITQALTSELNDIEYAEFYTGGAKTMAEDGVKAILQCDTIVSLNSDNEKGIYVFFSNKDVERAIGGRRKLIGIHKFLTGEVEILTTPNISLDDIIPEDDISVGLVKKINSFINRMEFIFDKIEKSEIPPYPQA